VKGLFLSPGPRPSGGAAPLRPALGLELIGPASDAFRVSRPAPRRTALQCEQLEVRIVPAAVVTWTDAHNTHLFSDPSNWSPNHVPTASEIVQFDFNKSNDPCTVDSVDSSVTVAGLTFINGYSNTVTIASDKALIVQGLPGGITDWTNGGTRVQFQMGNNASEIDLGNGGTFQAFRILGPQVGGQPTHGGKLFLDEGTFTDTHAAVTSYADVEIGDGATFNLNTDNATGFLLAADAKMTVDSGGTLALGDSNGKRPLTASTLNSVVENFGTVSWVWVSGASNTIINVALLNHGAVTIDDDTGGAVGLEFASPSPTTDNFAVKMDGGSLTLKHGGELIVDYGYKQTGGDFQTDNSNCYLYLDNNNRVAELDGGTLSMGDPSHFERLYIETHGNFTDVVKLHGVSLEMKIKGDDSLSLDQLWCPDATLDINLNSTLVVTNTLGGAVQSGKSWAIIFAQSLPDDFALGSKHLPAGILLSGPSGNWYYLDS
jgi:hypothetical protein